MTNTQTQTETETETETVTKVINVINAMDDSELIQLNNEYCQDINAGDSEIFGNDEDFLSTFFANNPDSLARAIFYGDYNYSHNYVRFNGYGNLETFNWFETKDLCELVATIAKYIAENPRNFTQFDEIDFN
jgi:uncharacterized protein YycO